MLFGAYSPGWFLGFDSILETLFLLVTLLIAWYAWKVHRFGGDRRYRRLATGFLLISVAYLANAVTNLFLYLELIENGGMTAQLGELTRAYNLGLLIHMLFFLTGYLILVLVSLRIEDRRLSPLLSFFILVTALASLPIRPLFEVATAVLLLYLVFITARNVPGRRSGANRLVLTGYGLVLAGQLAYILLPVWSASYVLGHLFELLGYIGLLGSMLLILKKR